MVESLVDDVILGGGCAGLTLACQLSEADPKRQIRIVEPRQHYADDRIWCDWDAIRHGFESAVEHVWPRWKLRRSGRDLVHGPASYRYRAIPARRFYQEALRRLDARANVRLRRGSRALAMEECRGFVRVHSETGVLRARRVFDGRPPPRQPGSLLQHFVGLEIHTAQPSFDPGTLTLMDFDVSQRDGIHFFYVLPFDRCHALVEATFFSPAPLPEHRYLDAIHRYLRERYEIARYEIGRRERGIIPLCATRPALRPSPRIYRIGTAAGLVRPSTGYAFVGIQRTTRELVERLVSEELPEPPAPRSAWTQRLDGLFLEVLRHHPRRAPELFERLFERVPADSLVRFLTDTPTRRDRLAVIGAMPKALFVSELWRRPRRRVA